MRRVFIPSISLILATTQANANPSVLVSENYLFQSILVEPAQVQTDKTQLQFLRSLSH